MEHWKIVLVCYFGIAGLWSFYTLFRFWKFPKNKNSAFMQKQFFIYLLVLWLIIAAMVAHLCCLAGSMTFAWPIFVVIGLMICGMIIPFILHKKDK